MKNSCAIFGGSGFIGSHLISHLLSGKIHDGIFVYDLVEPKIKSGAVSFFRCDVRKPISINPSKEIQTIYNLAALCKEPGYAWDDYFQTNHVGANNVCDFASKSGINKIIFASTMMVHKAGEEQMNEDSPTCPDTAYGISKLLAEKEHEKWEAEKQGRQAIIIRPAVVFGKGENANFIRLYKLLKRRMFFYMGRKTTVKSSVYVKDLVRFLALCAQKDMPHQIYNFAFPKKTTIQDTCEAFCRIFGFSKPFLIAPYSLALLASHIFEAFNQMGILHTDIHHRRIQKLYHSTFIYPQNAIEDGFQFKYDLESAIQDWKNDCLPKELY